MDRAVRVDRDNEQDGHHHIEIVQRRHSRMRRLAVFANSHSCSKLLLICAIFSCIITATLVLVQVAFQYVLPFILKHNSSKQAQFDRNFAVHLAVILLATLSTGNVLILGMRVLSRWLTVLLNDSNDSRRRRDSKPSIPWSLNAHYGSMQSLNRMILFTIPLMLIVKLLVFVMLYSFVDSLEFGVAVVSLCVFSRSLDRVLSVVENQMVSALMRNHDADIFGDDHSLMHLQDHHLLAQCNYIHDIIHYIVTLLE